MPWPDGSPGRCLGRLRTTYLHQGIQTQEGTLGEHPNIPGKRSSLQFLTHLARKQKPFFEVPIHSSSPLQRLGKKWFAFLLTLLKERKTPPVRYPHFLPPPPPPTCPSCVPFLPLRSRGSATLSAKGHSKGT